MAPAVLLQYLVAGLTYGTIYAVVGVGFNIVYNTTGVINFAQGEFVMLGGMAAVTLHAFLPLPLAVAGAVALAMAVGALVELAFVRTLRRPTVLRMIIVTIGVSILLREAALLAWGQDVRALPYFTGDEATSVGLGGVRVSPQVLWALGACAAIVAGLQAFFHGSSLGRQMRACAMNRDAAALCGVRTRRLVTLSFALAAGIGALAGCVVSPITSSSYGMGAPLAIKGFTVAVLGGLGQSMAAVGAGLLVGVLEAFSVSLLPSAYKDVIAVALLLGILVLRPSGLFGSREAARLKAY
jgi:branched-chain amino acid transport system permease protein